MTKPLTARIEVFRPGTFTPMNADPISYSAADLKAIADAYDPATAPAPIVVGHPTTDAPAYGWVESFDYDADAERLFANVHEIEPSFGEMVKGGRFKKVSMQYFRPEQANNPVPGTWYPKHVGFLGAAAPAVSGLKNVAFAGDEGVTFLASFGEAGFEQTAGLLRGLRDFLIARFGLEDADATLPAWKIDWLSEAVIEHPDRMKGATSYADGGLIPASPNSHPPHEPKETAVTKQSDPAFAEREASLSKREQELAAREAKLTQEDNASFAETLVQDGKLLPASKGKVVALLNALPGHEAISFSEGAEKISPVAALKEILTEQPKIVSFGETELGDDPTGRKPVSFAADGKDIDPGRLAIHEKALAHQRAHPGTDYVDAVKAVS